MGVRETTVQTLVQTALKSMGEVAPDSSVEEILSASAMILSHVAETVLKHSAPQDKEFNRQSVEMTMRLLLMKVTPQGQAN